MKCRELWQIFKDEDITFFTGVPDSTFKSWMSFLEDNNDKYLTNIIASNECEAVGIATGYHLSTNKFGVVYLQNAGLGKTVNPITSLIDKEIYSIPMLLMIGWRGEPGKKDEPQHKKMGRITLPLLELLEIPFSILPKEKTSARLVIKKAKKHILDTGSSYSILLKRDTLNPYSVKEAEELYELKREEAIETILDYTNKNYAIVSTTGKTSRELFEARIRRNEIPRDFYTVGSMGCASSISLGIALNSSKNVLVLDGDGATLMQMGTIPTIGYYKPKNLLHFILDNQSHESTGGQPTVSEVVRFNEVAISCGYESSFIISSKEELIKFLLKIENLRNPCLIVVKIAKGSRQELGRPTTTPLENKRNFMKFIQDLK